jgi:hypothetical protein
LEKRTAEHHVSFRVWRNLSMTLEAATLMPKVSDLSENFLFLSRIARGNIPPATHTPIDFDELDDS